MRKDLKGMNTSKTLPIISLHLLPDTHNFHAKTVSEVVELYYVKCVLLLMELWTPRKQTLLRSFCSYFMPHIKYVSDLLRIETFWNKPWTLLLRETFSFGESSKYIESCVNTTFVRLIFQALYFVSSNCPFEFYTFYLNIDNILNKKNAPKWSDHLKF